MRGTLIPGALAAGLALAIAAPAPGQAPAPSPERVQGSGDIVVQGNRRIEVGTILSYMDLPTDRQINAADLNAATRALFETGLFRDVQIVPQGDRLLVQVVENPSINEVAFEGNEALTDEDLRGIVTARPRFPFTAARAEADAQSIIETYRRSGYYGAMVEPKVIERSENRVDLVFEIEEGEQTGVNAIAFTGNEAFSDSRLREEIETSESGIFSFLFGTDVYDPDRLELDSSLLRRFYLENGYADFSVLSTTAELAPDRSGFFITFAVEEGEQYSFGTFDVEVNAEGLSPEDFLAAIPVADLEGETYNATRVEEIADDLTELAGEKGFAFVRVRPRADKDTEANLIDVTFELEEGPRVFVERIEIEGNDQTLDRVIRREIEIVEGDPFDARKIREARREIRGLDFFDTVEIETEQGSAEDRAVLNVEVEEKPTGSLSLGLGFASSVGPIGSVSVSERNFLGRGQTLRANVTAAGDTQVYDFLFREPRFLDRNVSAGLRTFFIQDDRTDESSFSINRLGFEPEVGFPLDRNTDLELRYSISRDDIDARNDASPAIQVDEGDRLKSSVGYRLSYDQRNDPIEPTAGYFAYLDQEVAGLGGDARFVKSRGSVKGWQGFFQGDLVFSLEVEGGAIYSFGDDTQVNDRFFLGSDSFRGFAREGIGPRDMNTDDALGGNYYAVTRLQATFPLGLPEEFGVFGGTFVDAGTLWGLDRTSFGPAGEAPGVDVDDGAKLRVSAGALLFLRTPFGPLELSVGFPIVDEEGDEDELFRLTVGTRF